MLSPLLFWGGDVEVDSVQPLLRDVLMGTEVELANNEGVHRPPVVQTRRNNRGKADSTGSLSHPSVSWQCNCMEVRVEVCEEQEPPMEPSSPRIARQIHSLSGAPLNVMNYFQAQ